MIKTLNLMTTRAFDDAKSMLNNVCDFSCYRSQLTYEFRKLLHMIFLPCVAAICFHSKALRIWGIILVVWYLLDRLYFTTRM